MRQEYKSISLLGYRDSYQIEQSKFAIKNSHYFLLINKKYNKALSFPYQKQYQKSQAILKDINQNDIEQIFLIQEILQNKFQIVHGSSALVLQADQNQTKLSFGKWKSNQFFNPNRVNDQKNKVNDWSNKVNSQTDKNYYWFNLEQDSSKHLFFQNTLKCSEINLSRDQTVWQLRLCLNNKALNKSCWIQFAYSTKVIDIPQASQKSQIKLIQYTCNYRFNQRFIFEKQQKNYFKIISLKTRQCLSCKKVEVNEPVIQELPSNSVNQLWSIQYTGNDLYIIRTAKCFNLVLTVKDGDINDQAQIILAQTQEFGFWKIIGNFLITQNRDYKF